MLTFPTKTGLSRHYWLEPLLRLIFALHTQCTCYLRRGHNLHIKFSHVMQHWSWHSPWSCLYISGWNKSSVHLQHTGIQLQQHSFHFPTLSLTDITFPFYISAHTTFSIIIKTFGQKLVPKTGKNTNHIVFHAMSR